jgi:hypothetical protein
VRTAGQPKPVVATDDRKPAIVTGTSRHWRSYGDESWDVRQGNRGRFGCAAC